MYQVYALDGSPLMVSLPEILNNIFDKLGRLPKGLVDVDVETGLAVVRLNKDKDTKMKIGKLLKKNGHTDEEVREISSRLKAEVSFIKGAKLEFANDWDDIITLYEIGPRSCMAHSSSVGVYSGQDTAVAYVRLGERVVARSVVVTNDEGIGLQYIKVYGNADLMLPLLHTAGYQKGTLEDCRFPLDYDRNGQVICPYFDCGTKVNLYDGYMKAERFGEYSTQGTGGILDIHHCDNCGNAVDPDETMYCETRHESLCCDCYDEGMVCINGEHYHEDSDDIVQTEDGDWIMKQDGVVSEYYGGWFHEDDCVFAEWEEDYFKNGDVVNALVSYEGEAREWTCHKENCVLLRYGIWVHEDYEEEYKILNDIGGDVCPNVRQGTLRFAETSLAMCI